MAQIVTKFIKDNAVTDPKIRLGNTGWLRSRNAANTADVNIVSVDASDTIQFGSVPQVPTVPTNNNDLSNKFYVDNAVANLSDKQKTEFYTLSGTDISNGYIDLGNPAFHDSVEVLAGGVGQVVSLDYSLSDPTAVTRVTFLSPLTGILASGDEITVNYTVATSLGSQQPSGKYTLSQLSSLTQVTGSDPTDYGQYRALYRSSSALVDASSIVAPNPTDGFLIYGNVGSAPTGTASQPTVYRIFIGKNKASQQTFWGSAGRVGNLNVDFVLASPSQTYGLHQKYDSVSGILEINGDEAAYSNRYAAWSGATSVYFDSVVSDNPVNIGTVGLFTGMIVPMGIGTPPFGLLECDGSAISRAQYSRLFSVIGTNYGVGDGSLTFNIPDCRGYFLRGWDHGAGNDPDAASRTAVNGGNSGDNVGSDQADGIGPHGHYVQMIPTPGGVTSDIVAGNGTGSVFDPFNYGRGGTNIGSETRPKNVNVMYCIVY